MRAAIEQVHIIEVILIGSILPGWLGADEAVVEHLRIGIIQLIVEIGAALPHIRQRMLPTVLVVFLTHRAKTSRRRRHGGEGHDGNRG